MTTHKHEHLHYKYLYDTLNFMSSNAYSNIDIYCNDDTLASSKEKCNYYYELLTDIKFLQKILYLLEANNIDLRFRDLFSNLNLQYPLNNQTVYCVNDTINRICIVLSEHRKHTTINIADYNFLNWILYNHEDLYIKLRKEYVAETKPNADYNFLNWILYNHEDLYIKLRKEYVAETKPKTE